MAFGPLFSALPLKAATSTTPATRYVDESSWNQIISNFSAWTGDVNGGGHNLSNVGTITSPSFVKSAGGDATLRSSSATGDNGQLIFENTGSAGIKKHFRLGHNNNLEVVNSAYTEVLLALSDIGRLGIGKSSPIGHVHARGTTDCFFTLEMGSALAGRKIYDLAASASGNNLALRAVADDYSSAVAAMLIQRGSGVSIQTIQFYTAAERLRLTASDVVMLGGIQMDNLPSSSPGVGTKKLWYDPADGNRVKFAA